MRPASDSELWRSNCGEALPSTINRARTGRLRISRMSVHGFITCQANISVDVGPRFHGMPVQDDAGRWIVSESSFGVNDC